MWGFVLRWQALSRFVKYDIAISCWLTVCHLFSDIKPCWLSLNIDIHTAKLLHSMFMNASKTIMLRWVYFFSFYSTCWKLRSIMIIFCECTCNLAPVLRFLLRPFTRKGYKYCLFGKETDVHAICTRKNSRYCNFFYP